MHAQGFFAETVVLLTAAVMEFPDARDHVTLLTNPMHPAWNSRIICNCVIPISALMRKSSGCHRRTGGNAQRACGIGIRKPDAAGRKLVQRRRLYDLVAIAANNFSA